MSLNLKLDHVLPDLDAVLYEDESVTLCQINESSSAEAVCESANKIQPAGAKSNKVASKRAVSIPCLVLCWPWGKESLFKNVIVGRDQAFSSLASQLRPYKDVSRLHAQIRLMNGSFYVYDLHSTNGTYVGEKRVTPEEPMRLQLGAQLRFAHELTAIVEEIQGNWA